MSEEDAATCKSCIFRLRFGFRRAIYEKLFLTNEPLVTFVRKLGIKGDGDVARLLRVFLDVDIRGTHRLDIETFFEYFGIEFTEYNKRAFRLLAFGNQDTGRRRGSAKGAELSMVFDQFFVSMYNYGTLLHEALVRFAFDVMASGKEACNKQDVMDLVSLLHVDVARVKETTATLMSIMDPHNRNKISFDTFRREERRLGSMLFPAFKLQKILRAKVLGQWFWRRATKKRRKARLIGADLCREYTKLKDEHLERLKLAKGTGVGGEGTSVGSGQGRGSMQVGLAQSNAADKQVMGGADRLNLQPTTPASVDDGYRPEGEDGPGSTSSSSSDSSDSDKSNTRRSRRASTSTGGGQAAAAAAAARRVSYAPSVPRGSASSGVETRVEPSARRRSSLHVSGTTRRQSVRGTAPNDESSGRRRSTAVMGPNGSGSSRRKPSLRPAVSPAGVSGRKGSMFEGMQMYAPSAAPEVAAGRRRSSSKVSRVTPGNSSFTGSVSQSRYPPIEEGG